MTFIFLRFKYNGCYTYLGDYGVPVLSIKCQLFSLAVKGLCHELFCGILLDVFLGMCIRKR